MNIALEANEAILEFCWVTSNYLKHLKFRTIQAPLREALPSSIQALPFKLQLSAGCSGLLRNHDGTWLKGLARNLGITHNIMAECWGIRDGLELAKSMNISHLILVSRVG